MVDLDALLRDNIRQLKPYSSARNEYSGKEAIFLDANENPFNAPYNRYPDPLHNELKEKISAHKNVLPGNVFFGNGSDEAIDLLIRAYCEPKNDRILSVDPTYGMYQVCAAINDVAYDQVQLTSDFQLDVNTLLKSVYPETKLMFLCSPNNPTGNSLKIRDMVRLIEEFNGLVVIDEAYIDFAAQESMLSKLSAYNNLVILQTFSKAWGLAGIRFGMAFATAEVIDVLYKIKYPYNLNSVTQKLAIDFLSRSAEREQWIHEILDQREKLCEKLNSLPCVKRILPAEANFLMIQVERPKEIYDYLVNHKIIIRDRSRVTLCAGCLRVTIGSAKENQAFFEAFREVCRIKINL